MDEWRLEHEPHQVDLSEANLSEADLNAAILRLTDLSGAKLLYTALDGANFERAVVGSTIFAAVDLSSCSGLDSVEHVARSTLGVDSIIRSKGRIPEIFLRGVGLPDGSITQIPSLVWEGIQFFSCFISYSSADKECGIHFWEKFLLCASKNSLTSRWVENEIKTTLEKEWALRKKKERQFKS